MVKRAFTLIEMIFVIVILSIIITGGLIVASKIYKRNLIASKTLELSFDTELTIDKLGNLLYYRVPLSAIGYDPDSGDFKYLGEINSDNYKIFEWIGLAYDVYNGVNFSGFADLYESNKPILKAIDFNASEINETLQNKFNTSEDFKNLVGIIFAGSFDRGDEVSLDDYNNSFGWHGNSANYVYKIDSYSQSGNDTNLSLKNSDGTSITHARIYEKFYLVDSAYAIARGADINTSANCISSLNIPSSDINDTLFLFYNYRPWDGETFCADPNGNNQEGNVSILSKYVKGFYIRAVNSHLEIFFRTEYNRGDITIKVSKQKVVF